MSSGEAISGRPGRSRFKRARHRLVGLAIGLAVAILLWTSAVRTVRLWGLPRIDEPFDLKEFEAERVPEAENGYRLYLEAKRLTIGKTPSLGSGNSRIDMAWAGLSTEAKAWIEQNQPALESWRAGTNRVSFQPYPTEDPAVDPRSIEGEMMTWSRVAQLEASRLEGEDDPGSAWRWHLARLRFALQSGRKMSIGERWSSSFQFNRLISQVQGWADHPEVTVKQLRQAISDLEAMEPLYPKRSDTLKRQYLWFLQMFDDRRALLEPDVDPAPGLGAGWLTLPEPLRPLRRQVELYMMAEPERSQRVLRLTFANWLAQADKAPSDRARTVSVDPLVFETDPGQPRPISPEALVRQLNSAPLIKGYRERNQISGMKIPIADDWPTLLDAERRAVASVIVTYASRIFEIETGKWPASPEALVGTTLPKLPDAFLQPDGGDESINLDSIDVKARP